MLYVFYKGVLAAKLRVHNGVFQLKYEQDYVSRKTAIPLSPLLPLESGKIYQGTSVLSYLVNLQPENPSVIQHVFNSLERKDLNALSIMDFLGQDAPGVFTFSLNKDDGLNHRQTGEIKYVDTEVLKYLLATTQSKGVHQSERVSLAGFQPKTSMGYSNKEGWYYPTGKYPSTHIFKPERKGLEGHAVIEHLCMRVAKKVGIDVAKTNIMELVNGTKVLVSQRYDRSIWGSKAGQVKRIHQVDFLQCIGYLPDRKYEEQGGFTARDFIYIVQTYCPQELEKALKLLIFNYEIGNFDNHGKNFSLLRGKNGWELAPGYDIANLSAIQRGNKYAMAIAKEQENIDLAHWSLFAQEHYLNPDWLIREIVRQRFEIWNQWNKEVETYCKKHVLTPAEENRVQKTTLWFYNRVFH